MNTQLRLNDDLVAFPAMPDDAAALLAALKDGEPAVDDAVQLIEERPSAARAVAALSAAIDPVSPKGRSILSIVSETGPQRCLEMAIAGVMTEEIYSAPELADLHRHSLASAIGAVRLVQECRLTTPGWLFLSAMLHDAGLLLLLSSRKSDFESVVELSMSESISIDDAERRRFGVDHGDVGSRLVKEWGFPEQVVDAVKHHHAPEEYQGPHRLLVDLVHVSDALSRMVGIGISNEGLYFHTSPKADERIGMTSAHAEATVYHIYSGMDEFEEWLG